MGEGVTIGMLRIVIADDELNIIELFEHMLDPRLAEVVAVALNGIDAYEAVKEHRPDILITDVRMPGYTGIELIEKVKQTNPETDIIVISGYREFDYLQSILKFGVQEFLLKPVDDEELNGAVRRMGQKRGQKDDHARYVASMEINLMDSYDRLREEYTLRLIYDGAEWLEKGNVPKDLFRFREGYYSVGILKADLREDSGGEGADMPYVRTLLERYRNTIVNAFHEECYDISYAVSGNKVFFVFNYPYEYEGTSVWDKPAFNQHYISDMLATENYKYGFLHFSLGIGAPVRRLGEIDRSLRSALCAVGNRLSPHSSGVIIGRDVAAKSQGITSLLNQETREQLSAAVVAMDVEQILSVFDRLAEAFAEASEYYRIYDLAVAMIAFAKEVAVLQNLMSEDDYTQVVSVDESIDNCDNLDMLRGDLKRHFESLATRIQEISSNRASKPIRTAIEFMQKNYSKQISLREVADAIYYSPNYFCNAFKKQTGMSFLDYLTKLRMDAAKELLRTTMLSVGEIASEVGYTDKRYFSKLFIQTVGIKPNEFRKFYS